MHPPRTIMDSKDEGSNLDFGFAFNDINFSDRLLRIEIEQGDKTEFSSTDISLDDGTGDLKKRKKNEDSESLCNIEVKSIHINSAILGVKSPFFLKLFSNGMKESKERIATLRIHSSEEVALMDLLNFMYNNTLKSETSASLVDVLLVADKFQVSSCIKYSIKLLRDLPMTYALALQFLHLPSIVMIPDEVQPLTDAATKHVATRYKAFTKFEEVVINFSLLEIEAIFSSDDLQVISEDVVYEFVLKWARKHIPMIENRREILKTRLASLIRFGNMTTKKLTEVLSCDEFDHAYASKVVTEALDFKAESSHLHTFHASRAYTCRPVKVTEFMFPHPHCFVYLDLKKEDCDNLILSQQVYSSFFRFGKKLLYLLAERRHSDSFGMFLGMSANQSGSCAVSFEFLARSMPTKEFMSKWKTTHMLTAGGEASGCFDLFKIPWNQFIAPDSIYFIDGVLYLKVEIAMIS